MKLKRTIKNRTGHPLGLVAVEAALVLPLLILVTFGAIDLAQYINMSQMLSNASREGARIATRSSTGTVDEIEDTILNYLSDAMPQLSEEQVAHAVKIEIKSLVGNGEIIGGAMNTIASGDPISVYVEFDFTAIRWIGGLAYWGGNNKHTRTICRRE